MDRTLASNYKIYRHQNPIERRNYANHIIFYVYFIIIVLYFFKYMCERGQKKLRSIVIG